MTTLLQLMASLTPCHCTGWGKIWVSIQYLQHRIKIHCLSETVKLGSTILPSRSLPKSNCTPGTRKAFETANLHDSEFSYNSKTAYEVGQELHHPFLLTKRACLSKILFKWHSLFKSILWDEAVSLSIAISTDLTPFAVLDIREYFPVCIRNWIRYLKWLYIQALHMSV